MDSRHADEVASRQADEVATLLAIYDGSPEVQLTVNSPTASASCPPGEAAEVRVQVMGIITATFLLPRDYPAETSPGLTIKIGGYCTFNDATLLRGLNSDLEDLLERDRGNEVLFSAVEIIRMKASGMTPTSDTAEPKTVLSADAPAPVHSVFKTDLVIFHSTALVERKSTFIAHICEVRTIEQVREFRNSVLADKRYGRATHNIFAYRFTCPITGVVFNDCDDDGENAAGARLAEMLRLMSLRRGTAIIVSRWFGGTLLGPDRFKLINNTARHLLEEQGFA